MGLFSRGITTGTQAGPAAPGDPDEGGPRTPWTLVGVWHDGVLTKPARAMISLSEGREINHVGETIMLTRLEAATLNRSTMMLVPKEALDG